MRYLRRGGIAEQFDLNDDLARNYQEGLIQKIILDDIIKRYQIDKINILKESFNFICGNITSTLSLRKIVSRLENQGLTISTTTLDNYIYYWQTAYAINKVTRFDNKLSKVFDRTAKYYTIDNLLISGREESDEKRLENLIYIELVRRYGRENINFQRDSNGYEIDFVVKKDNKLEYFQVCLYLNDKNVKREARNIRHTVLTLKDIRTKSDPINIMPVIEWLLTK